VLTGLIKRISPDVQAHALDETDDGWLPEAPAKPPAAVKPRTAAKPSKARATRPKDPKAEA
jgi:hypothetical protein